MELLILKFKGADAADEALKAVSDAQADRHPWLHEVGVVRRPLVGRITIRTTYAHDDAAEIRQGDLASKAADVGAFTGHLIGSLFGPLHADMAALKWAARATSGAKDVENKLMRIDDIKEVLPRGSSALVLAATPRVNDEMLGMFTDWSPEAIRMDVAEEIERGLQSLDRQSRERLAEGPQVSP